MKDEKLIDFIKNIDTPKSNDKLEKAKKILPSDLSLYHIEELTFEDESPRKKAFENVLSSLRIDGISFVYLLLGDRSGVSFYFGIVKDKGYDNSLELNVDEVGNSILKSSIEGNFRGSKVNRLTRNKKSAIKSNIDKFNMFAKIEGLPSVNEDNEEFQGVDRLVDVMIGDEFGLIILADSLANNEIKEIENRLFNIYDTLSPLVKKSKQMGHSDSETKGTNKGDSKSKTTAQNDSTTTTETTGTSNGTSKGTSDSQTNGTSSGRSIGTSTSDTHGTSSGKNSGTTTNISSNKESNSTQSSSSKGSNEGKSHSAQLGTNKGSNESKTHSTQVGKNTGSSEGENHSLSKGETEGVSNSDTIGTSSGENFSTQTSTSDSETLNFKGQVIMITHFSCSTNPVVK